MRIEQMKNKIIKHQMLLILYMTLAVGFLGLNQTDYGILMNQQSASFLKHTKEFLV